MRFFVLPIFDGVIMDGHPIFYSQIVKRRWSTILQLMIERGRSYSLIAFDERVSFWLQRAQSLPCACAYVALFARRLAYNHYAIAHAYNAVNAHAQGSDQAC